jgi:hypothetical protein
MRAAATVQRLPEACALAQRGRPTVSPPWFPAEIIAACCPALQAYKDQTLRLEVVRGAEAIGAANGVVSGGPVAFEVNHPGEL